MELLLGCGSDWTKKIAINGRSKWTKLVTLDHNSDHHPDVVHDLEQLPYPFEDNSFDEIHAYEVLEHTGQQGDWRFFFAQFSELWRILKPGGYLAATTPSWKLSQEQYRVQVGKTAMSDFRFCYKADFEPVHVREDEHNFAFVLRALKG